MTSEKENKTTLRTFAWASFLNDLGSDMIYPIWPIFVKTVLGAPTSVLGLVDGLGDAIVSLSQAFSGYLSDKIHKRKVFIWLGYLCGGLSRFGYALVNTWQMLVPLRILDRAGKMRGAPRDAILADISTNQNRGRNFGVLRAMDNLGAVVGIILCIVLLNFVSYRTLFLIAAIPSLMGVVLIMTKIKERPLVGVNLYRGFTFKQFDKNLKLFLILSGIFALGSFSYSFLLLYAKQYGFSIGFVPVLYLLFNLIASLTSVWFGKLTDKIGRKAVLAISYMLWALVCLALIISSSHVVVVLAFILYGLHKAAIEPSQKTVIAEMAPPNLRASYLGGLQMILGFCALPASLAAGLLWDTIGLSAPLYVSLGLTVFSLALFPSLKLARSSE